jgi:hypothetical protein
MKKEEGKACKIPGNARSAATHWRPMHHPKRVQVATRSASSSTLPVTYPTVATQEVIRDLDLDALARLKSEYRSAGGPIANFLSLSM